MTTKAFKVVTISVKPNSFGLYGHVLMAEDGEAWEVGRSRLGRRHPNEWSKGQIVQIQTHEDRPQWHKHGVEIPRQLPKAPDNVVAEVWGKGVAA